MDRRLSCKLDADCAVGRRTTGRTDSPINQRVDCERRRPRVPQDSSSAFSRRFARGTLTVLTLNASSAEIWRVDLPAIIRSTWYSRSESASCSGLSASAVRYPARRSATLGVRYRPPVSRTDFRMHAQHQDGQLGPQRLEILEDVQSAAARLAISRISRSQSMTARTP